MRTKKGPVVRETPSFIEAARRTQIIGAALETIAELGFANASLAQIAKKAGISKSVIGYYFPTKDDLVRQSVEHFYMTGHMTMMTTLETATSPTELLKHYIRTNLSYIDNNRVGTRAIGEIISNFRTTDGELAYKLEDTEPMIQGTAAMFQWGQDTGDFRKFDTRVMAIFLRGCVDTFGQRLGAFPDLDVGAYIREMTEMFIAATRNPVTPAAGKRLKTSASEATS